MNQVVIGIDIGGTSIKGGAVTKEGKVLSVFSFPVKKGNPQIETMKELLASLDQYLKEHDYDVIGIGLGIPGTIDIEKGVVVYSNNLGWKDLHIQKMVEEHTKLPVRIINDASAATLGEHIFGWGKEYQNIVLITLGTGVGSGLILNGEIYEGSNNVGVELGHMSIKYDGEECTCGRKGCLEAYASATALARDTRRMMNEHKDSLMWNLIKEGHHIGAHLPFIAEREGDKYAKILIDNYVKYLGIGLTNICNIYRPDAIVLSGGIANEGDNLIKRLEDYLRNDNYGFSGAPKVRIMNSKLGYDAGKIGAAALFYKQEQTLC